MAGRYFPGGDPVVGNGNLITELWRRFLQAIDAQVTANTASLSTVLGVNRFALAGQPSLGAGDAGYVGFVTDYAHLVYWDGSAWQWLDADVPGRFEFFGVAPSTGWGLCDGTAYTYLVVGGGTLTTASFTTPDLVTNPTYFKSGAYTGSLNAKSGSTATGSTGTGTTGTGTTGTGTTGTGTTGTPTSGIAIAHTTTPINADVTGAGATATVSGWLGGNVIDDGVQTHPIPGLSIPGLSVPGLSIPSLSVGSLSVGTIDMENLRAPVYFRR